MCKYAFGKMTTVNTITSWQPPIMHKDGNVKDTIPPAPPQLLLLTLQYPGNSASSQFLKAINHFGEEVPSQPQVLLHHVDSLLPFTKNTQGKNGDKFQPLPILVLKAHDDKHIEDTKHKMPGINHINNSKEDLAKNSLEDRAEKLDYNKNPSISDKFLPVKSFPDKFADKIPVENESAKNSPMISFESVEADLGLEAEPMELDSDHSDLSIKHNKLDIHDDINLPNALCDVGWETDSSSDDDQVCHVISDKPVVCRAKATLPANYLYFSHINNDPECVGVFAGKTIPKRAQFGPMDGVLGQEDPSQKNFPLILQVEQDDGSMSCLDVSNEELSNWMRYVRCASSASEQNITLSQVGKGLFYTTRRPILEGEELKVWYSPGYAAARLLPLLSNSPEGNWQCSKCTFKCPTIKEIQSHLETHLKPCKKDKVKLGKYSSKKKRISRRNSNSTKKILHNKNSYKGHYSSSDLDSLSSGQENFKEKRWCCSHCERCFNTPTMLNFHMLAHAADNIEAYSPGNSDSHHCKECSQNELDHEEGETKLLICDICSKSFVNHTALACHKKTHSEEKKFECPICNKIFEKVLELKAHIHSHSNNGVYTCTICSKEFTVYKHIRKHIRSFHSQRTHKCSICIKRFPTQDKLKTHLLSHSDQRQFLCANCGKQFKRKDKLSEHMRRLHYPDRQKPPSLASPNKKNKFIQKVIGGDYNQFVYKCHICVVGFKRRGMLVNHIANRHPDITLDSVPELNLPILKATKDYFCQYCDKIYKSSSKRKAHILKYHPGEKLPLSNRQLGSSKDLPEHENGTFSQTVGSITTNPHSCQWCHKQYASKAKLLQHQRNKHLHLLPKSLQYKRAVTGSGDEAERCDQVRKVAETKSLLQDSLIALPSEYEISDADGHFITEGEFIVDASILKKALRGEIGVECLSEYGVEQIESRGDQYYKVTQTEEGITVAQPVEIWDQLSLSPPPSDTFLPAFNPR